MFKSGFMPNCQNLETAKRSFNRQMDKDSVLHPDNEILNKEWTIEPQKDMDET